MGPRPVGGGRDARRGDTGPRPVEPDPVEEFETFLDEDPDGGGSVGVGRRMGVPEGMGHPAFAPQHPPGAVLGHPFGRRPVPEGAGAVGDQHGGNVAGQVHGQAVDVHGVEVAVDPPPVHAIGQHPSQPPQPVHPEPGRGPGRFGQVGRAGAGAAPRRLSHQLAAVEGIGDRHVLDALGRMGREILGVLHVPVALASGRERGEKRTPHGCLRHS